MPCVCFTLREAPLSYLMRVGLMLSLVLGLVVLFGASPAPANDQTCDHLISAPGSNTVGVTISAPGIYCLATDVIMAASFKSGNAIEIAANYVTLDLNGHKIHGASAGTATQAIGIHAQNRVSLTIKNGTVWGFMYGILLNEPSPSSTASHLVEGVRAENNRIVGIYISGGANVILRHNIVTNTGPTTIVSVANAFGIDVFNADNARVLENDVLTVTGTGTGNANGMFVSGLNGLVVGNRITNVGGSGAGGVTALTAKCRDNLTNGVIAAVPINCNVDAGGNN